MKKLLCAILALCLLIPATGMAAKEVVNVFNWEDYIDRSVIEQFEQETGITVNYMCFTTNEDMLVQVEANPGAFDVIFPSEYCVERLNGKGLLAEINYDNIPNSKYLRAGGRAVRAAHGAVRGLLCGAHPQGRLSDSTER